MILTANNPWTELPVVSSGRLSRRRVNAESPHELIWFRDENGYAGLFIEVHKKVSASELRAFEINLRDVLIEVIDLPDAGVRALSLRLTDSDKTDIFFKLCHDIAERVTKTEKDGNTFQIVCRRLKKWQSMFAGKSNTLLTKYEIQGLYAELYFLSELIAERIISEDVAIRGWTGPNHAAQDFILNDTAVEIKSVTAQNRGKVRISSEDQLYSPLSRLYLRVYLLNELHETAGENLNALVRRISDTIRQYHNTELFEERLTAAGYVDIPDYDEPHFEVKTVYTYLVSDGFPRIVRHDLASGVEAVSYDLMLAEIDRFRASTLELTQG